MSEMRKTGGYMTVEVSAVLPIVLMVLWLFFSYLFYFMNCGIASGIIEEAVQKAADIRVTGADYETGRLSYIKQNQKLMTGSILSSNKSGDIKAEKEIKDQLGRHLFMARIGRIKVSSSPQKAIGKVTTQSNVIAPRFLSMFGIRIFEYEAKYQTLGDFEIEQIRRWNAIDGAVD